MEAVLQEQICSYLRLWYPGVLFRSDVAAGMKLTMGQAVKHRRLQAGRAWPDLFIAHPAHGKHGLFLELKRESVRVFLKDGTLSSHPHIREQAAMLEKLRGLGYAAEFGIGFDATRRIIDDYLS